MGYKAPKMGSNLQEGRVLAQYFISAKRNKIKECEEIHFRRGEFIKYCFWGKNVDKIIKIIHINSSLTTEKFSVICVHLGGGNRQNVHFQTNSILNHFCLGVANSVCVPQTIHWIPRSFIGTGIWCSLGWKKGCFFSTQKNCGLFPHYFVDKNIPMVFFLVVKTFFFVQFFWPRK